MDDLISRRAVLKHIEKIRYAAQMMDDTRRASILMNGMHLCEEAVRNQTSAEKTGRWIYTDGKPATIGASYCVVCDQCGEESEYCTLFCPNCGARMEGTKCE